MVEWPRFFRRKPEQPQATEFDINALVITNGIPTEHTQLVTIADNQAIKRGERIERQRAAVIGSVPVVIKEGATEVLIGEARNRGFKWTPQSTEPLCRVDCIDATLNRKKKFRRPYLSSTIEVDLTANTLTFKDGEKTTVLGYASTLPTANA